MPRDQFQRVTPGSILPGLPSRPWNQLLDSLKGGARPGLDENPRSPVVVRVKNGTANPLTRFSILQVTGSIHSFTNDQNQFFDQDSLAGNTPAAGTPFVVIQEPITAGGVGWARLLGLTRVKVTINATTDRYADCTTATDKLSSAATGAVRIIDTEDHFGATGDKWCVVELPGVSLSGGASLIGTWTPSSQTIASGGTFTYSTGLQATVPGLYLLAGVINGQSTTANNVSFGGVLLRTSSSSSAGFFHYLTGVFLPLSFNVGYMHFNATLTVTAADLVSGPFGVDVKLSASGGNVVVSNTAGYGLALIRLA